MSAHAILSPSSASRWLVCTPSARLEEQFPDTAGRAAEEGTLAHSLGELLIRFKLKMIKKHAYEVQLDAIKKHALYENSMFDYCEAYADFVVERFFDAQQRSSDAEIHLETKIDLTAYIPEGFGTADADIVADYILDFIDFKFGKGVPVFAEKNRQLMTYAAGLLKEYDWLYSIKKVRMTIHQPRLDSISTWEIDADELRAWAENELKPTAEMAFAGKGDFVPGDHCKFCKAKGPCAALAAKNLEIAEYEFKEPTLLKPEEISDILDRAKLFTDWVGSVQDYALRQAVENGAKWPGYKVVEGRSNRTYSDPEKVAQVLKENGHNDEDIFKKSLKGITEMEKTIGKAAFATLADLIIKPAGKPTLAPLSDKRPEMNSIDAATADFADHIDN